MKRGDANSTISSLVTQDSPGVRNASGRKLSNLNFLIHTPADDALRPEVTRNRPVSGDLSSVSAQRRDLSTILRIYLQVIISSNNNYIIIIKMSDNRCNQPELIDI